MPKVEQDVSLQQRLNAFLVEVGMSVPEAAAAFGVNRISLWRFSRTGKALATRRDSYLRALDRATNVKRHSAVFVSDKDGKTMPKLVGDRELLRIRKACESVLRLLDAYESQLGGSIGPRR